MKAFMGVVFVLVLFGLKVPESVMYDEKNQVLYVSNINGKPTLKNNKGFITNQLP